MKYGEGQAKDRDLQNRFAYSEAPCHRHVNLTEAKGCGILQFAYSCYFTEQMCTFVAGPAVVQLVEALRYKPEGRVFDSRCSN
jgi:hypothetical protein